MDDIKQFAKNRKRIGNPNKQSWNWNRIWRGEFAMQKMRNRKRQMKEWKELQNNKKIKTHWEKKTYKYLGILEVDIIKQAERKEKD